MLLLVITFTITEIKMKRELNKTIDIVTQQKNILEEMTNYYIDKIQQHATCYLRYGNCRDVSIDYCT